MDILYIIGENCSKCNYNELRYSLRSIEKYGKNIDRIFVAGYCPEFLSDEVIKIPCDDIYEDKENHGMRNANVLNKLLIAVDNSDIGEHFLVSFDDNIYIRDTDFDNYPHYIRKNRPLPEHKETNSAYMELLANTKDFLLQHNLSVCNFGVHRNLHCTRRSINANREILEDIVKNHIECDRFIFLNNWELTNHPFEIKVVSDVKLKNGGDWWRADSRYTECFSTCDFSPGIGLDCLISSLFNDKSKYEK